MILPAKLTGVTFRVGVQNGISISQSNERTQAFLFIVVVAEEHDLGLHKLLQTIAHLGVVKLNFKGNCK